MFGHENFDTDLSTIAVCRFKFYHLLGFGVFAGWWVLVVGVGCRCWLSVGFLLNEFYMFFEFILDNSA